MSWSFSGKNVKICPRARRSSPDGPRLARVALWVVGRYPVLRRPLLVTQQSETSFIRTEAMRKPDKTMIRRNPPLRRQTDKRNAQLFQNLYLCNLLPVWQWHLGEFLIVVLSGFRIDSARIKLASDHCVTNSGRRSTGYPPDNPQSHSGEPGPIRGTPSSSGTNFTFFPLNEQERPPT